MSNPSSAYSELITTLKEISLLGSVGSLLGWDEQVNLPPGGAEHRSAQSALIARMTHEKFISPRIGELLSQVEGSDLVKDPESDAAANARETRREYDRARKIPPELVEELARVEVLSQHAWAEARKKSDFKMFQSWLEKTLNLKKREANCVGFKDHIYDALIDPYEPHATTAELRNVLESLRGPLVELIGKITSSGRKAPTEIMERKYPAALQEKLARMGAETIGFDFNAGRLDVSLHPFCSGQGPGDTRMTTRYDENYFIDAFMGVLHETGHSLYEQGLPKKEHFGEPIADSVSLGIHESQSRTWENLVGRSRAFWVYFLPKAKEVFGASLNGVKLDDWVWAVNDIRPTFIRTESDEATYNLHILLRFEMETAMMSGDLSVSDVPGAWNEKMKKYLGITPPDDARGCLQDIHWSGGSIGYFATYTLGNLYGAQFCEQARKDLGDLDAMFARGEFRPLLDWLRKHIHRHGRRYTAKQLVKRVTGKELSAEPLFEPSQEKGKRVIQSLSSPPMRSPPALSQFARYPATSGTIVLAAAVSFAWWSKVDISPLLATLDIRRGQIWRLLTSVLPHANFLHLAFNLYWVWVFGSLVEEVFGHVKTIAIIMLLALGSGAMEFALLDGGVGLSGVGYGLFGMLLVLSRRDSRFAQAVDQRTVVLFVVWFFICIYTTLSGAMMVANIAHAAGAILGALVGCFISSRRWRWLSASAIMVILVLGIVGATIARPYVNFSADAAADEAHVGYEALVRSKNNDAVRHCRDATRMNPKVASYWFNLGIAYSRVGRKGDAANAYARAFALNPNDKEIKNAYDGTRERLSHSAIAH